MSRRAPVALFLLLLWPLSASGQGTPIQGPAPVAKWFKGNTHSHAGIVFPIPHGDSSPHDMAEWYAKRGYNFLTLSDHNQVGRERHAQGLVSPSFILISGTEITSDTRLRVIYTRRNPGAPERIIHTTGFNISPQGFDSGVWRAFTPASSVVDILRMHRQATERAGGMSILNHPNFRDPISAQEIIDSGIGFFEVYNAYPHSKNGGSGQHPSTEALWDQVLSAGTRLYAVASDDAHHTKKWNRWLTDRMKIRANPGGGWIMVRATQLTPGSIVTAMKAGQFYASNGVHLQIAQRIGGRYSVAVDLAATRAETSKNYVADPAPAFRGQNTPAGAGVRISFITQNGRVAYAVDGLEGSFPLSQATGYLRVRVDFVSNGKVFSAWTQPVF